MKSDNKFSIADGIEKLANVSNPKVGAGWLEKNQIPDDASLKTIVDDTRRLTRGLVLDMPINVATHVKDATTNIARNIYNTLGVLPAKVIVKPTVRATTLIPRLVGNAVGSVYVGIHTLMRKLEEASTLVDKAEWKGRDSKKPALGGT